MDKQAFISLVMEQFGQHISKWVMAEISENDKLKSVYDSFGEDEKQAVAQLLDTAVKGEFKLEDLSKLAANVKAEDVAGLASAASSLLGGIGTFGKK